jgi:hypothetical protein
MLNDWFATGARRAASDAVRRDLLGAAERLQPRQIKIGGEIGGHEWPWGQLVETFADLCRQAADVGTRIAFEPMPFGQINNLVLGRRLIDEVTRTSRASSRPSERLGMAARGGLRSSPRISAICRSRSRPSAPTRRRCARSRECDPTPCPRGHPRSQSGARSSAHPARPVGGSVVEVALLPGGAGGICVTAGAVGLSSG